MRRFAVVAASLYLVACGDDGGVHHLADAPPAPDDAGIDAPPAMTTVNITTLSRQYENVAPRTPHPGALVFAVGPTGALVAQATTDAAGKATVSLPGGGSITVVYPAPSGSKGPPAYVTTYVGVKPGDSLTFGDDYRPPTGNTVGSANITWAAVTDATRFRLSSPCSSNAFLSGQADSIELTSDCAAATAKVALTAYDDAGTVLATAIKPAAPYTGDVTIAFAAGDWVAQAATPNYTINVTNLPADANQVQVAAIDEYFPNELGPFWFSNPPDLYTLDPVNQMASKAISVSATATGKSGAAKVYSSTAVGREWLFKAGASPLAIDAGTIPQIQTLAIDTAARTVSWTQSQAGTYDAAELAINWSGFSWLVILPPGIHSFDAKAVPAELQPYVPTDLDGLNLNGCQLVDLSSAASYDAFRALPEWRATSSERALRRGEDTSVLASDCGEGYHF